MRSRPISDITRNNIKKFLGAALISILPIIVAAILQMIERSDIRIVVHPPVPCADTLDIEREWVKCRVFDIANPLVIKFEFSNMSKTPLMSQKIQFKIKNDSLIVYSFSKTDELYSEIDSSGFIEKTNGVFHYYIDELIKEKDHKQYFIANIPITAKDIEVSENLGGHKVVIQNKSNEGDFIETGIYISVGLIVIILFYYFVIKLLIRKQAFKSFKAAIDSFDEE